VYFETNSSKLTAESSAPLDEAGAALAKYPALKLEVEGHTDARGSAAYNLRLSQARAQSVRQYLIDRHHLNPAQVTAKGYGSAGATQGATAEQLKQDRRVVLRVLNPEALPKNVEIKQ
jgi:OOP family OmpA-OmpF porin